jgi:hypothetical protein
MEAKQFSVGIFEVKRLSEFRWHAHNTLTTFEHVTYGTEVEIVEVLQVQSEAWKKKFSEGKPKGRGSAWRQKASAEFAAAKAAKQGNVGA